MLKKRIEIPLHVTHAIYWIHVILIEIIAFFINLFSRKVRAPMASFHTPYVDMNELALEIHEHNKAIGLWGNPDPCIFQTLHWVLVDIVEATEGGEVGLADVLMRLLDVGGRYKWTYTPHLGINHMLEEVDSKAGKHLILNCDLWLLTNAVLRDAHINYQYSMMINGILHVGECQGYDVMGVLAEKQAYF